MSNGYLLPMKCLIGFWWSTPCTIFCDQREAIKDLLRVLKPGGRLVIEEPDLNHFGIKLLALAEKMLLMRSHFYPPQKIREMISACGYSAKIENDDHYTAWVVADK